MDTQVPTSDSTLVIIFGASKWPHYSNFEDLPGARNSALAIKKYFLDRKGFGLPADNLLYLFNAQNSSPTILEKMSRFLRDRTTKLRDMGQPAQDIIIYYVGHGDFANPTNDYFLAVYSTRPPDPYVSSIPILSLARALKEETRHLRRYIIIDSCFSGAAVKGFLASGPVNIAAQKTGDSFPLSGTAILCSSGARDPSKAPLDLRYTMFSGALIDVLRDGSDKAPDNLNLQDLVYLTRLKLREQFEDEGVRPEVHAPEQKYGKVDETPIFPNLMVKQGKAIKVIKKGRRKNSGPARNRKQVKHPPRQNSKTPSVKSKSKEFRDQLEDGSMGPDMILIPAGQFQMGDNRGIGNDTERPEHPVEIVNTFAIGKYALTFEQYDQFCSMTRRKKPDDFDWGRGQQPVINVSWMDAVAYSSWLSDQTGHDYRLPTEAEWEYAARAGKETNYWWGDEIGDGRANCNGCGGDFQKRTKPISAYSPNQFGLYNMLGNVFEWVQDSWHDSYRGAPRDGSAWVKDKSSKRVLRGGSWYSSPNALRSSYRSADRPDHKSRNIGFRLARSI